MKIIIPMAGKGERFSQKGYTTPKPLINVSGLPMVVKAVSDLPEADEHVFILLEEHLKNSEIDKYIRTFFPKAEFVTIDKVTEGQACTTLLGLEKVSPQDEILIGACDNGMVIDKNAFNILKADTDVIVFTFRNNVTVVGKPQQYGWVKVSENGFVKEVSVKIPISSEPINDHAVVGAFWFKNADIFIASVARMISQNRRINNEFYIDECINDAVALGYKVSVFEIEKYICWGTPNDYQTYNYWESYFRSKN